MSTVQALIDQWRIRATAQISEGKRAVFNYCADQLAAILASPSLQMQEKDEDVSRVDDLS